MRVTSKSMAELIDALDPNGTRVGNVSFSYRVAMGNRVLETEFNYGRALGLTITTWSSGWLIRDVAVRIEGVERDICKVLLRIDYLFVE